MDDGAWMRPEASPAPLPPRREPMVRAPWPALTLALGLVLIYAAQTLAPAPDAVLGTFGFSPRGLEQRRWTGLVTALFIHGSWAHVGLNALGALAFGAPVARLFGTGAKGASVFALFYLACGVISSLGYAALRPGAPDVLVGASGAVSGLMGAASRLIERRPGLAPFRSPTVIGMAAAWVIVNLIVAVVGFGVGTGGAPVAWQAHLVGYAAGLFLLAPTLALLRRP